MENVKYVCPNCGYESDSAGSCPGCRMPMVATCSVCGNPMVGEQISMQD